jgi:hypothetical protein
MYANDMIRAGRRLGRDHASPAKKKGPAQAGPKATKH